MDGDSDTGFDSQESSADEVSEKLEERGTKRKFSKVNDEISKTCKKLKKVRKENDIKKLHKPPTANELNHLRETENLFHSNLFRLQIEEMLKEVSINEKHALEFEIWYEKFSEWLFKIEDNATKYKIIDQKWLKKLNVKIPISQVPYFIQGSYQFKKPSKISIIGSYAVNVTIGPKFTVDVLIEMPLSFFQKKDFINGRFHRKRSLYICELIHHIQLMPNLVENIDFVAEETDKLKPKVEITPYGKLSKYVKVVLHMGIAPETFKLNRFTPDKNNVRRKWYFKEAVVHLKNTPTPFYNSTIAADLTLEANMKFLKVFLSTHINIREGIILLKIWLRQRELHDSIGGFNGFIISMLVCYLVKMRKLNPVMSSYQIFRNVCHYLSICDWTTNGITLCDNREENLPTIEDYHANYEVVFVDVTGYYNFCYAMSSYLFKNVQHEAKLALKWLSDPDVNSFQVLFITKVPFYQHYDHVVMFNNGESLENIADIYCSKESQLSHCGVISPLVRKSIIDILHKGFGKRITHLHFKLPEKKCWKVTKKPRQELTLIIGFNLDPENYFSIIDKALETETEAFRKFWGSKSELRRFQDGSITEALVWNGRTLSEKRLICKEILTYLLKLKFGLDTNDFQYIADQLNCFITKDNEELSLEILEIFDELSKQLRNLNDLPLDIVSIQGISPAFRYTDVLPPVAQKQMHIKLQKDKNTRNYALINLNLNSSPPWVNPVDLMIQMAASNKWPQDLEAIKRVQAAFNVKISDSLTSQYGLICKPFQDRVEIVKCGFVFRIKIIHLNEITLLKQTIDSNGLIKYKDTEKSLTLEKHSVFLPKLSSALHGLYQKHNSFGPACCLIKRWIASHLMDGYYISEETVELLVASLYLRPEPHEAPIQPQVAFFRFLQMIVTVNWNTECIVLNLNGELSHEDILEIESEFNNNRHTLPTVFIATPFDRTKSIWTKDSPTPLILLRLIKLCANALQFIEAQIYSTALSGINMLFEPCLDTFDVIITLRDSFNSKKKAMTYKNANELSDFIQRIPINDFDPVSLYVKELRETFQDFALFFYDCYGGSVVAVKWKPNVFELHDFKIGSLPARLYNSKANKLEINKEAILEDFWVIGKNLVDHIDIRENDELKRFEPFIE